MLQPKQKKPISARDQEKVDIIINSTCSYFSIDKSLMEMPGKTYTKVRRICYMLISKNTDLSHTEITSLFNKSRSNITRGIELMAIHSSIYAPISHQVKDIVGICNSFTPKQYEWLIHN